MDNITKLPLAIGNNASVLFAGFNMDRTKIAIIKNGCLWLRDWKALSFVAGNNGHRAEPPTDDSYYQFLNFIAYWGDEKMLNAICTGPNGIAPEEDEWVAAAILAQLPGVMDPIPLAIEFCTETVGGKRYIRIRKNATTMDLRALCRKFFDLFESHPISAFEADEYYYSLEILPTMPVSAVGLFEEEVLS